jgi:hypothetical protein
MITQEFFEELEQMLRPGVFTQLANGFAHYADSDIIRREYRDIGDNDCELNRQLAQQERALKAGW